MKMKKIKTSLRIEEKLMFKKKFNMKEKNMDDMLIQYIVFLLI